MMAMLSRPSFPKAVLPLVADSPMLMTLPMLILSIGAITLGYLANELFLSYGSSFYLNSIFTHPSHLLILDAPFAGSNLALLPLGFLLLIFIILIISFNTTTPTRLEETINHLNITPSSSSNSLNHVTKKEAAFNDTVNPAVFLV